MSAQPALPVHLPRALAEAIIAQARVGKPEEICGVLRGRGLEAFEAIAGRNMAADPVQNYEVDPKTLLLQVTFENEGDELMGVYHSHPVSVAYPSATDAWNAYYPDAVYFICSLEHDDTPVIRAYHMITHFLELDLLALRQSLAFDETRPGLFAYYQADDAPVPDVLAEIAGSRRYPSTSSTPSPRTTRGGKPRRLAA